MHIGFGSRPDFPSPYAGDAEGLFTAYPWLAGFIAQDFWSQLEPTQGGSLDFSYLDLKVAQATAVGKPILILIKTGGGSATGAAYPSWVVAPSGLNRPVFNEKAAVLTSVCPWDSVLLDYFLRTVQAVAARYDKHQWVRGVYVAGPTDRYPEMQFIDEGLFRPAPGAALTIADDPLTAAATTITASASTASWPASGGFCIDETGTREDVRYSGRTGSTFTGVTRGVNGTTAASHALGVTITKYNPWTTVTGGNPAYTNAIYEAAWLRTIRAYVDYWRHTPVIALLDHVFNVAGGGTEDPDVFGWDSANSLEIGVVRALEANPNLAAQVTVGTANVGDDPAKVAMDDPRYARLRAVPVHPTTQLPFGVRKCPIYYELATVKMLAQNAASTTESLRIGREVFGARAIMVPQTLWAVSQAVRDAMRDAYTDYWL